MADAPVAAPRTFGRTGPRGRLNAAPTVRGVVRRFGAPRALHSGRRRQFRAARALATCALAAGGSTARRPAARRPATRGGATRGGAARGGATRGAPGAGRSVGRRRSPARRQPTRRCGRTCAVVGGRTLTARHRFIAGALPFGVVIILSSFFDIVVIVPVGLSTLVKWIGRFDSAS